MAHYQSITGKRFVDMLLKDGWSIDYQQNNRTQISKPGYQPIAISTGYVLPVKRIRALCVHATISTTKFDELFVASEPPNLFSVDTKSPSQFKH